MTECQLMCCVVTLVLCGAVFCYVYIIHIELEERSKYFRVEIRNIRYDLETMRSNFHKEIHDIKNELVVARNGLHEEVHDVKNELEATGNSFREEIRDITNDLEGTKNKVLVEIREIKNELKTVSSRFHEEIRGIRNDSEITRGNFLEEIHDIKNELREVKDTFPEEIHAIENGLEATRRNFHSIHETSAYFGSLLSVQTTKGLFIHDLMKPGLDKDSVEFNSSSLHRTVYLSKSKKILSNTMFPLAVAGPGEESLQRYEGAKAVNKVTQGEDLRLKFIVRYEIKKTCRGSAFIFDVTFCDDKFDMFFYGGYLSHCLSMYATCDTKFVNLKFENQRLLKHTDLSPSTEGTTLTFGFDVVVSGVYGYITFRDLLSERELFIFNSVNFSEQLVPMFGVFNPEIVECMIIFI